MFKYKNAFARFLPVVFKSIVLLFVVVFLSSCLYNVHVTSNTFADEKSIPCGFRYGSTFFIKSAKKDDPLFSKEVAYKIENIIKSLGYNVVQDVKQADYCLVFNFEMLSTKQTKDVLKYEPGETIITQGRVSKHNHSCHSCCNHESVAYTEETSTPGQFYYVKQDYMAYQKELFIEVYDANLYKETKKQEQLWKGYSSNCNEDHDLRVAIDYLLISAFKNFGRNTRRNVYMSLSEKEIKAEKLRLGLY